MKHLVHFVLTQDAAERIESQPGGPGPVVERMFARFKPEVAYFGTARREGWWVIDFASQADIAEAMIALSHIAGNNPEIVPVVSASEFPTIIQKSLPAAHKLLKG